MEYDLAIFIGRFQPIHSGHIDVIQFGLSFSKNMAVLVGSTNVSRSPRNPWSYAERRDMVMDAIKSTKAIESRAKDVLVLPIKDYPYNDNMWYEQVQSIVSTITEPNWKICVIGFDKDPTTYYLRNFPQWDYIDYSEYDVTARINATSVRELMFSDSYIPVNYVSESTKNYINKYREMDSFKKVQSEHAFYALYKKQWENSPYPPSFITADAVVVQSGHILLVKRRQSPGAGLMALPGGFVSQNETFRECCIRELREETRIKVPETVLNGSIEKSEVFDHPRRSQRGRTVTMAFLIDLGAGELAKVRGGDDAEKAFWLPLNRVMDKECEFFEDHFHIIRKLISL